MRAVNLLPRDERRGRLEAGRLPLMLAGGGVVVVTAASMLLAFSASGAATDGAAELAAVEDAIARLPVAPDSAVSQGMLARERSDRVAALAAALASRVSFDQVLHEISFVFPEEAWLTQLEAVAPVSEAPVVPGATPPPPTTAPVAGVTIQGAAFNHDSVALVLSRLSAVPSLENVRLSATALVEPHADAAESSSPDAPSATPGKAFVTFVVTASLRTEASR